MAEQKFPSGAVVKLKSGGPRMTVMGYDVYGYDSIEKRYLCRWFGEKNKVEEGHFTEESLTRED
jgi:uncharacterized protein YodC (DUF2158 family)